MFPETSLPMPALHPQPADLPDLRTDSCRTQLQIQSHASAPGLGLLLLVLSCASSFIMLCTFQSSYLENLWLHF